MAFHLHCIKAQNREFKIKELTDSINPSKLPAFDDTDMYSTIEWSSSSDSSCAEHQKPELDEEEAPTGLIATIKNKLAAKPTN